MNNGSMGPGSGSGSTQGSCLFILGPGSSTPGQRSFVLDLLIVLVWVL
jgi:hypothetical protein